MNIVYLKGTGLDELLDKGASGELELNLDACVSDDNCKFKMRAFIDVPSTHGQIHFFELSLLSEVREGDEYILNNLLERHPDLHELSTAASDRHLAFEGTLAEIHKMIDHLNSSEFKQNLQSHIIKKEPKSDKLAPVLPIFDL
ncbi:MAG: hypothetical protein ACRBCK_12110 [Alphaproteobacteria bacterium]